MQLFALFLFERIHQLVNHLARQIRRRVGDFVGVSCSAAAMISSAIHCRQQRFTHHPTLPAGCRLRRPG